MKKEIDAIAKAAIESGVFPGCVIGITRGDENWCEAWGTLTYEVGSRPVTIDTVYDVASITKSIPVGCMALSLVEQGCILLDEKLCSIIPEYSGGYRETITIRHLLTQTLDYGFRLSSCKNEGYEGIQDKILTALLHTPPGTKYSYANATSILLGWVIERKTGKTLDEYADEQFFKPLGMTHTTFFPKTLSDVEIAPTEFDPWRNRVIHAEVHDESAAAMMPHAIGASGLFSTGPDLLHFARMLISKGILNNKQYFQSKTVVQMYQQAEGLGDPNEYAGYGWELCQPHFMGKNCTPQTFGKTGFTGCSIVIEPQFKTGIVLLSNHVHPNRRKRTMVSQVSSLHFREHG